LFVVCFNENYHRRNAAVETAGARVRVYDRARPRSVSMATGSQRRKPRDHVPRAPVAMDSRRD